MSHCMIKLHFAYYIYDWNAKYGTKCSDIRYVNVDFIQQRREISYHVRNDVTLYILMKNKECILESNDSRRDFQLSVYKYTS
jgi:nucleoside-diphosphate-sugar epimerase